MMTDFSMKYAASDLEMMSFVQHNKTVGDVYLVPAKMQDFRLATGAPIYIDFKSIPYKDTDVLEWYRRHWLTGKFYQTNDCELLAELAFEDGITHLVLAHGDPAQACPNLSEVYLDDSYGVFEIDLP